jgi:homoserine O-acetyltransferase
MGQTLDHARIAYRTYGQLNAGKSNAVLVFHALTGSHNASGVMTSVPGVPNLWTPECHTGWWSEWIGPGQAIDTNRYFVICANYLGGCYGSTGPSSIDLATGRPWGSRFPRIMLQDIVDSQMALLDHLGIDRLLTVVGASLGGMMALDVASRYSDRTRGAIPIASGMRSTMLTRLLNLEQILAIEHDPNFRGGDYYDGPLPHQGMRLARMIAHKSFISLQHLEERSGATIVQQDGDLHWYRMQHQIESYMLHQGRKFVQRFDANTYLRLMDAWQAFDLCADAKRRGLRNPFETCRNHEFLIFSIDSDVCFYPEEQAKIVNELKAVGNKPRYVTIHSEKGHDSFLLECEAYRPHVEYMLSNLLAQAEGEDAMQRRIEQETAAHTWFI